MEEKLPKIIGRYRVEKKLGQGAMGVVYLAHDEMIDRKVAVKSIRFDNIDTQEEQQKSIDLFFKEAKIIGKLSHSHITSIYDMGIDGKYPFLVMEYVAGETIKDFIKGKKKLSLDAILKLLSMIARGLHYANQRGVLNRDIKPANIMIMKNSSPKIMDFGIARMKDSSADTRNTETEDEEKGVILGTPHYMSPEQIRGKEMDQRSDVFALGVLAYEWISGNKPFAGATLKDVIRNIVKKEPEKLSSTAKTDSELDKIIHKALEKNTDDRYSSAEEFSDALELYLNRIEKKKEEASPNASGAFSVNQLKIINQLRENYLFFRDFTEDELFNIFLLSIREKYQKDEVIVQEGTSGAKMYVILKGKVAVTKENNGSTIEVIQLIAGDCFGEMAIIDKLPRSASVISREETTVLAINETVLRNSNPQLCLKLYRSLSGMISEKLRASDTRYLGLLSRKEGHRGTDI